MRYSAANHSQAQDTRGLERQRREKTVVSIVALPEQSTSRPSTSVTAVLVKHS